MNLRIKYMCVTVALFMSALFTHGQTLPPWDVYSGITSVDFVVTLENPNQILVGNEPLSGEDYVGLFTQDDQGEELCLGFTQIVDQSFIVLMDDLYFGSEGYFKLWKADPGCEIDVWLYVVTNANQDVWDGRLGESLFVLSLTGQGADVGFQLTPDPLCPDDLPAQEFPLELNPDMLAGQYTMLFFDSGTVSTQEVDYVDRETGEFLTLDIPAGNYTLEFQEPLSCSGPATATFEVLSFEICNPTLPQGNIIAPSSSDQTYAAVELGHEGNIQIYNGAGVLVRTLQGPTTWDGTDEQGRLLPTDEYYVRFAGGKSRTVTILR